MGYLTDLTDEQWAWIEPVFSPQEGPGRRRSVSLRRVIDALMYQDRTGCQWRLIPRDVDTIWDSPLLCRQMERRRHDVGDSRLLTPCCASATRARV